MRQIRRSANARRSFYDTDLAFVHDTAFGDYARRIAPEIARVLHRRRVRRGTIVELGCGSGITAAHLVASGFDVHGIDRSRAMIQLARPRVPRATFRTGSIWSASFPPCRAVVAVGEVINYAAGRTHDARRLGRLFRRVRSALSPDGIFIFDFMESAEGRTYSGRRHAGPGWSIGVSATADRRGQWLTRRMTILRHVGGTIRRTREVHRVRLFDREEVGRALAAAGFAVRFQRALGRVRMIQGDVIAVATVRLELNRRRSNAQSG